MKRPKLLYLVTEDWYFCSHRLPIAREAQKQGYEVLVATRVNRHGEQITSEGFKLIPLQMQRRSTNLFTEIAAITQLITIYRREKPDVVHHVAIKPVLYGSLVAFLTRVPFVVNALAGMGYIFTSKQLKAKLLRPLILTSFRLLLDRACSHLILQNPDDCAIFTRNGLVSNERIRLIRGSGVDTKMYQPLPKPTGSPVVLLASRMLWDKGIEEFVEAANLLKDRGIDARFVLVGDSDMDNPNSVPCSMLRAWNEQGVIEWWGKKSNMPEVFEKATVACLPSAYGEGVPKVLLEAAACGIPIVTTDAPGCREVVLDGENGFLVPVKSALHLANALQALLENPQLRKTMGARGREIVVKNFAVEKVVAETMSVYGERLNL